MTIGLPDIFFFLHNTALSLNKHDYIVDQHDYIVERRDRKKYIF